MASPRRPALPSPARLAAALGLLLLAAGLLAGCAEPTPYQAKGPDGRSPRDGYAEQKLAEDRYRITVSGNEATSRETVEDYLLFRAAELAGHRHAPGFRVVAREVVPVTRYATTYLGGAGGEIGSGMGGGLGRPLGYAFVPGPLYSPGFLGGPREVYRRPVTHYNASAEIELLDALPAEPASDVYATQEVLTRLAPVVGRPASPAK
ncbi:hypothetical protein SAMN06265365_10629 [Tistlia consotensis]|uniref:DUF4136 domain-containing protein n=1 Tax=Tistlia consotensis USBA 355 TaxID=560819 RepID=A0A1Y6BBQ4_9PROT|nr:hypothetical protein [Tistlia consotensis]SMF02765.1 hypothetical protein SAMN05428998_10380 [Tistlia consotensis USBA 355]SNR53050.1 hypothetical protein SAMN06265365_10629 [Tistlia consotensis]